MGLDVAVDALEHAVDGELAVEERRELGDVDLEDCLAGQPALALGDGDPRADRGASPIPG